MNPPTPKIDLSRTLPFSLGYYAALELNETITIGKDGYRPAISSDDRGISGTRERVDDAVAASAWLNQKHRLPGAGGAHYYNTAIARRLTLLGCSQLGGRTPGEIERFGFPDLTVGEIEKMTDAEIRARNEACTRNSEAFDAVRHTAAQASSPPAVTRSHPPATSVQLWEPCEKCGAEPSYITQAGHLCKTCHP